MSSPDVVAIVSGVVGVIALLAWRARRRRQLAQAMARLGLQREADQIYRGRIGVMNVALDIRPEGLSSYTWLTVSGDLPDLVMTGHPGGLRIAGDDAVVAALFDDALRGEVTRAIAAGWTYDGFWLWERVGRRGPIDALVLSGVALADRLRAAYAALPDHVTAAAKARALAAERIDAALETGDDDDPAIRDVTDVVIDDDHEVLARAPLHLERAALTAGAVTVSPILRAESMRQLVASMHTHLAPIDAIARGHLVAVLDGLTLEPHVPDEVAIAMADVLTRIEHPRAEAALVALLAREKAVQRAAIAAIGAVGSVAVVPALSALRDGAGRAGAEAKAAIERIQARAGRLDGALSIAETSAGLALVDESTDI